MNMSRNFVILSSAIVLSSCAQTILKEEPIGGSIPYNETVLIENDGRCSDNQIIEITGGNNKKNIPRKYSCIARPD